MLRASVRINGDKLNYSLKATFNIYMSLKAQENTGELCHLKVRRNTVLFLYLLIFFALACELLANMKCVSRPLSHCPPSCQFMTLTSVFEAIVEK